MLNAITQRPLADNKTKWDPATVKPASYSLTAEDPVRILFNSYPACSSIVLDMHAELEVGVVCTGTMVREYEGVTRRVGPGGIWFCGTWEPHGCRVIQAPCEVAVFVVSPTFAARLSMEEARRPEWFDVFSADADARPVVDGARVQEVMDLSRRLKLVLAADAPRTAAWARIFLQELLLVATRGWHAPALSVRSAAEPISRIAPALNMLSDRTRFVTTSDAATACGMSRNTFARCFRDAMGIAFSEYSLRSRLKGAAVQLLGSAVPVKAVAAGYGFTDQSHLHRMFVRYFGCTPQQYRERGGS